MSGDPVAILLPQQTGSPIRPCWRLLVNTVGLPLHNTDEWHGGGQQWVHHASVCLWLGRLLVKTLGLPWQLLRGGQQPCPVHISTGCLQVGGISYPLKVFPARPKYPYQLVHRQFH